MKIETLINDTLLFISKEGWTSDVKAFYNSLSLFLAEKLGVTYVLIGEYESHTNEIQTLALVANGQIIDNIRYNLSKTPCENVVGKKLCTYPEEIQRLFPEDEMLVEMKAESYIGIPLWDMSGIAIGLISLIDTKPVEAAHEIETILRVVAIRASHEIERRKYEAELIRAKEVAEENEYFFKESQRAAVIGSYKLDIRRSTWISSEVLDQIFGIDEHYQRSIEGWLGVIHPEDAGKMASYFTNEVINEGKSFNKEYRIIRRTDSEIRWVLGLGELICDSEGNPVSLIGTIQDITKRKLAEIELQLAKEKAEESDKLKTSFLANMSHEIRTPMNGILGFLSLLDEPSLEESKKKKYTSLVHESGQRLLTTINDIIEMSKIEAGESLVRQDKVSLSSLLSFIYNFFKPQAESKGLKLQISEEAMNTAMVFQADRYRLENILINLVKNAIKFTTEGSIELAYYFEDSSIVFYVRDSGIGIPASKLSMIFDRFVQGDMRSTREHEGSGLGLSIARSYVESMNGSIWVQSVEGKGSTFSFSIPFLKSELKNELLPETTKTMKRSLHGANILIAEDDEASYEFLNQVLTDEGAALFRARNGKEALEIMKDNSSISLVLMDIRMPEMDGLEATRKIREFNSTLPIIAQTAFAFDADKVEALNAGCNAYITKPVKKKKLLEILHEYYK